MGVQFLVRPGPGVGSFIQNKASEAGMQGRAIGCVPNVVMYPRSLLKFTLNAIDGL